jgi:ankyrin repeat protein
MVASALQAASYGSNKDVVKILLEKGADVNCPSGPYGSSLHAVLSGQDWDDEVVEVVEILIEHGANVNAQAGAYGSVLERASMQGDEDLMQIFRGGKAHFES